MSEKDQHPGTGLRERKKRQRHQAISDAAIALFLARGFERVSVAEVAAAAEISKPTLFRYFPTKEDLVLHRFADHEDEAARVVSGARRGRPPVDALRRHFLAGIERSDPVTGLNDDAARARLPPAAVRDPALVARLYGYLERSEDALAAALGGRGRRAARRRADHRRAADPRAGELAADRGGRERRAGAAGCRRGGGGGVRGGCGRALGADGVFRTR